MGMDEDYSDGNGNEGSFLMQEAMATEAVHAEDSSQRKAVTTVGRS